MDCPDDSPASACTTGCYTSLSVHHVARLRRGDAGPKLSHPGPSLTDRLLSCLCLDFRQEPVWRVRQTIHGEQGFSTHEL
jgi:hypothetical protein